MRFPLLTGPVENSIIRHSDKTSAAVFFVFAYRPYLLMGTRSLLDNPPAGVLKGVIFYPVVTFDWFVLLVYGLVAFRHKIWHPTRYDCAIALENFAKGL